MAPKQTPPPSPETNAFPKVDLLPLDADVEQLVADSIHEATTAQSEQERSELESQVFGFVEEIDRKEVLLNKFSGWFAAARGRHDDVPTGIATFLDSLRPASAHAERERPSPGEIIKRFEDERFVTETPRFAEILEDTSRTAPFEYDRLPSSLKPHERDHAIGKMTEHEGLLELSSFVDNYITKVKANGSPGLRTELQQAESLRENLTFIGGPEFAEATHGLAVLWKSYLDADPDRQICLTTEAASLARYSRESPGVPKSDSFVAAAVKRELFAMDADYERRIVSRPDELKVAADKARVIVVDDWTVSGAQMFDVSSKLLKNPAMRKYRSSLEINLLVAPRGIIESGMELAFQDDSSIPVRAYFRAFDAPKSLEKSPCHITGLHSTVNMGFSFVTDNMARTLNERRKVQHRIKLPALASVYRDYWRSLPNYAIHARHTGKRV